MYKFYRNGQGESLVPIWVKDLIRYLYPTPNKMGNFSQKFFLVIIFFLGALFSSFSQTTLSAGDIGVIRINTDGVDGYSIINLVPLSSGTTFTVTEQGWRGSTLKWQENTEPHVAITLSSAYPAGTVFHLDEDISNELSLRINSSSTIVDTFAAVGFSFVGGDQVIVYQGTKASPTFITGLTNDDGGALDTYGYGNDDVTHWLEEDSGADSRVTGAQGSRIPTGLTNGVNAISLFYDVDTDPEKDNSIYIGPNSGTRTQMMEYINNRSNWMHNDATPYSRPTTSFTVTPDGPSVVVPSITTSSITGITENTAFMGGNVSSDGGASVTEKGVVYSSSDNSPEIGESGVIKDTNGSGTGSFGKTIFGLSSGTNYYFRAYATNSAGTAYGTMVSFTTTMASGTPADQNFNSNGNVTGSGPIDIDGIRYTGGPSSDRYVMVDDVSGITPSTDFSGKGIMIGNNNQESPGYAEFFSIDNSRDFKISSFLIETYSNSGGGYATEYTIIGYNNGVQKASTDVNMLASGNYGSGSTTITYAKNSSGMSTAGRFTFTGSGWGNVDHIRIQTKSPSLAYYYVGLDDIDFEDPVTNSTPTGILLSSSSVNQSAGNNATVGTLSTTDADISDSHSYSLVSGTGDSNNGSFNINGNALRANNTAILSPGNYSVRVQTDDGNGGTYQSVFSITVVDNVAPSYENSTPSLSSITISSANLSVDLNEEGKVYYVVLSDGATAPFAIHIRNGTDRFGSPAPFSGNFTTSGTTGNIGISGLSPNTSYDLWVMSEDGIPNLGSTVKIDFTTNAPDSDGNLTDAGTVSEPVDISSLIDTQAEAIDIFDFNISDGGSADGLPLTVSQIAINVSGTSNDLGRSKITFRLDGNDASNAIGVYNPTTDKIIFSGLSISVANGTSETYTVNAYFNDNTGIIEDQTVILSIDGDTDLSVGSTGTQMGTTSVVSNGSGSAIDIVASQLVFSTQPAGSISGQALTTQPTVSARDAYGNIDSDFSETITLTEASAGSLTGTTTVNAVNGVAVFSNVGYSATVDQETFGISANDQDGVGTNLSVVGSNVLTSDVVASKLIYATQPAPLSVDNGKSTSLTTVPVVKAVDSNGIVDTGYSTSIILAEVNGAGSASMSATSDTDGNAATISITPSSGIATFIGMQLTYIASGTSDETFNLQASSGGLSTANSNQLTARVNNAPTASSPSISGSLSVAKQLTGNYSYSDLESDPESGSTYKWYRAEDNTGSGKVAISGATEKQYTLQAVDQGKYISFEVTPSDGTDAGTAVESDFEGPVKIDQAITFPSIANKTYGGASFTLGNAQTDQGLTVTYTATDPNVVSITGNQATILKAGNTQITATQSGDGLTNAAAPVVQTLTVGKATLTVTADDKSKVYGSTDPVLKVSYSGFENGDDETALGGTLAVSRATGEDVGNYVITASGYTSDNYTISYTTGNFEITKATLMVTAEDKSKVYGSTDPLLTVSYTGFKNGDDKAALGGTLAISRATGEDVGNYVITASGYTSDNYTISYTTGNFEITKATLMVTAEDKSKVYGSTDPLLTVSYTGFKNGDDKAALGGTLAISRATGEDVGNYVITASGYTSDNYTISYTTGNFEITKATLMVTAEDKSKVYGSTDPLLTVSYTGFKNGDDKAALGGTLAISRATGEDVGNYVITASGYTSDNYTISYTTGNFEITKATLMVTAEDKSKVYGSTDPLLTVSYTGFKNGDDKAALGGTLAISRATGEDVGNYVITASGYTSDNYTISYTTGNFEITKATLMVTAEDKSKVYGSTDPLLTVSYTGFKNGDDKAALGGTLAISRATGEDVGNYVITASGYTSNNYTISYTAGDFEITKATLTVLADDKSKVYGATDPVLTVSYTGFKNGDDKAALGGTLAISRTTGEDVGNYVITASGYTSDNYTISYTAGDFEITKATLTVLADDKSKVYGATDPVLTVSYTGFKNGDDKAALGGTLAISRTTGEDVGNYAITATGYTSDNYTINYTAGNFEITKATLTVTADDKSKVYGSVDPSLTVSYSGFENGDDETALGGTLAISRTTGEDVGNYAITASGYSSDNYTISYTAGNFEVTKATLTVTAEDKSKVYGSVDPSLTVSYSGFENGDDESALGGTLAISRATGENVGNYAITATGYTSDNYTINYTAGNFEITKATLTVTADDKSKVYGSVDPSLTVSYSGFENGDDETALGGTLAISRTTGEDVGNYAITASGYSSDNYTISYTAGNFEVTKATLTVTAEDKSKVYGSVDPSLTVSYSGFENGDDESALGGTLAISRATGENVGNYTITATGYTSDNYTISYTAGDFEITKATLTVTADDKSKVYGSADPVLTVSYSGFENGDDKAALGGTLDIVRTTGENVGNYAITTSGYTSDNYTISYIAGNFEITKATLTVTADDKSKVYGSADPSLTVSYSGFVNGDDETALGGTLDISRAAGEDVGTYAIIASGYKSSNYTISYMDGSFAITQAALTVTADDQSKVYGDTDPSLIVSYSGFVNGDDETALGGTLAISRSTGEDVGNYAITASGYTSDNYTINYTGGNFEITKATLMVTADDKNKVYGSTDPVLTVSYSGFENGDDETALGGTLAISRSTGEDVGNYAITASGYTSDNYTISYTTGNLEITKATLTVTADDKNKVYGSTDPVLTVSYSGFENGDDETALGGTLAVSRATGEDVGNYTITASGYTSDNYTINYTAGNFEITKATLTVTADDKNKVYGSVDPSLTVSYSGFENGDDEAALGGTLAISRTTGEDVGNYAITATGYTSDNYTINYTSGNFEITKATLTVTADDKSKVYGSVDPSLTVSYSGFVNGDDEAALGGTLAIVRTTGEDVGNYTITASGYTSDNYTINYTAGNFEVTKATLMVAADDKNKVYGSTDPVLTVSYSGFENGDDEAALGGTLAIVRTTGEDVGNYTITASGYTSDNYTINYTGGNFEITKATLTVLADDKSKVYGSVDPSLTVNYTGFGNGDDETALGGTLAIIRATGEDVGNYAITASGYTSDNYSINYTAGDFEITKATLTVLADDKSKVYGSVDPSLTVSYSGFENGDDETALGGTLAISRSTGEDVGNYAITASGYTSDNYTISYTTGNFEVTKATLTVTADDKNKVYGSADPSLTVSYSGFVNGDDQIALDGTLAIVRTTGEDVGNYAITASGYTSDNYTISYTTGNFEVTKATLTVTADDKNKVYGSVDPSLTVSYSGFENGDDEAALGGTLAIVRTTGEDVGNYAITATGYSSDNYTISYTAGNFEITQATLTVTADDKSKVFGTADPALTYVVSGLVNGDGMEVMEGNLDRSPGEEVGIYPINKGSLSTNSNYLMQFTGGEFTIEARKIEEVYEPAAVEVAWGVSYDEVILPETVLVRTEEDEMINLPVRWDRTGIDLRNRGSYTINGELVLPSSVSEDAPSPYMDVVVLPKPAPTDLLLDHTEFEASVENIQIAIGGLEVIDPVDDVHMLDLVPGAGDNQYFLLSGSALYWSSNEALAGRTSFTVVLQVMDADGNILEKSFTITRLRKSLDEIEIYNTFTPNQDGTNDTWGIEELKYYTGVRIMVFERSGKRVFLTTDPETRWDGTFNGKELAPGSYFWVVETGETDKVRRGTLNLLRR
ncbi:MBG domain-containing protein [Echinicola sp. 20G]|uniref:MBG domain-containing protein n=1 Tax=Echinicola sp. 20G TaxID=2781961 RepID=UPI0019101A9A|nr:MBG domain-containing protein [Echinicola sp. 20G]